MRLPGRISRIVRGKDEFIEEMRAKLEKTSLRLQADLLTQIINDIVLQLETENGVVIENAHNYQLISQLEQVYKTFNVKIAGTILPQINKLTGGVVDLSKKYFEAVIPELPKRFEKVIESTKKLIDLKIGLRSGKMIRGGLTQEMLTIDFRELQQLLLRGITSEMTMKDFVKAIKESVRGDGVKVGTIDRQLKRFAYDTYQQYDAAYNKKLAEEFGFKYFVYEGGLIDDSRDFCAAHNAKVWSIEESEEWKEWTPSKGKYPEGYEIKAKNLYEVPSYMDYPGYDPLVDRGGYNCRHFIAFIPDDLAFKMRPELQNKT